MKSYFFLGGVRLIFLARRAMSLLTKYAMAL